MARHASPCARRPELVLQRQRSPRISGGTAIRNSCGSSGSSTTPRPDRPDHLPALRASPDRRPLLDLGRKSVRGGVPGACGPSGWLAGIVEQVSHPVLQCSASPATCSAGELSSPTQIPSPVMPGPWIQAHTASSPRSSWASSRISGRGIPLAARSRSSGARVSRSVPRSASVSGRGHPDNSPERRMRSNASSPIRSRIAASAPRSSPPKNPPPSPPPARPPPGNG
jgi:hypothetical protein